MNRRNFLSGLIAATAFASTSGLVFDDDPEKALWVPGNKKIFIPKYDLQLTREQLLDYFWKQQHTAQDVRCYGSVKDFSAFAELRDWEWDRTSQGVIYKHKWSGKFA